MKFPVAFSIGVALLLAGFFAGRLSQLDPADAATPDAAMERSVATTDTASEAEAEAAGAVQEAEQAAGGGVKEPASQARLNPEDAQSFRDIRLGLLTATAEEMPAWFARLREMPAGEERDQVMAELFEQWGRVDPITALFTAADFETPGQRELAFTAAFRGYAEVDPEGALRYVSDHESQLTRRESSGLTVQALRGLAVASLPAAFASAAALEPGTLTRQAEQQLLETLAEEMVAQGRTEAAAMLIAQLPEGQQAEAWRELGEALGRADPENGLEFLARQAEQQGESFPLAQTQAELVRSWAGEDPAAAAAFLDASPDLLASQPNLVAALVREWSRYDLEASGEWLNAMEPSEAVDRAVGMYAMRAASEDPAAAMDWAQSVDSNRTRGWVERRVASMWYRQDPQGFETYLASADRPAEEIDRLRRAAEQDRGPPWWMR
ncbi:MAG: hypothetical protein ACFB21_10125 [Opitutales bacterium]